MPLLTTLVSTVQQVGMYPLWCVTSFLVGPLQCQVAIAKGDYQIRKRRTGFGQLQTQMILSVINAATTWVSGILMALSLAIMLLPRVC